MSMRVTPSSWPSHSYRRYRAKQKLDACIERIKAQNHVLAAIGRDDDNADGYPANNEVVRRLQAMVPCIAAQVHAASIGKPSHSDRLLVDRDTHAMGIGARHLFDVAMACLTPAKVRSMQRGRRGKSGVPCSPPPAKFPDGAIHCYSLEHDLVEHALQSSNRAIPVASCSTTTSTSGDNAPSAPPPLVEQLPNAIYCSELEMFRHDLYSIPTTMATMTTAAQEQDLHASCVGQCCSFCGVWLPLESRDASLIIEGGINSPKSCSEREPGKASDDGGNDKASPVHVASLAHPMS